MALLEIAGPKFDAHRDPLALPLVILCPGSHVSIIDLDDWEEFKSTFKGDQSRFAWCHWDGTAETEAKIKEETKVTIRCIPLPGQGPAAEDGICIFSGKPSKGRVLMAKAY